MFTSSIVKNYTIHKLDDFERFADYLSESADVKSLKDYKVRSVSDMLKRMGLTEQFTSLRSFMRCANGKAPREFEQALLDFRCLHNPDAEAFLLNEALEFDERNICNTYFLIDEELFIREKKFNILAFFTLSFKFIEFPPDAPSFLISDITGYPDSRGISAMLIGQMAIQDDALDTVLSYSDLIFAAMQTIKEIAALVPVPCVLVECEESMRAQYREEDFVELQNEGARWQMVRQVYI